MPTLQLTVWESAAEVALGDLLLEEVITISGTSAPSASVIPGTKRNRRVRLFSDTDCFVTWGPGTPVAKTDGTEGRMLAAESPEYFAIPAGEKVAVILR